MKVKEITSAIEAYAPLYLQEDYDNAGMQVGNPEQEITGVLLCTDVREPIVDEAIARGFNLVISHLMRTFALGVLCELLFNANFLLLMLMDIG